MPLLVNANSRLRFKEFLTVNGVSFWELDALPTIPKSAADLYYTVEDVDRMDLLATRFYGNPNLWWVLAVANDMDLIPTGLRPGAVIRVPSPDYVTRSLFTSDAVVQ